MKSLNILAAVIGLILLSSISFACTHNFTAITKITLPSYNDPDRIAHIHNRKGEFKNDEDIAWINYDTPPKRWIRDSDGMLNDAELELTTGWKNETYLIDYIRYKATVNGKECTCSKGHVWVERVKTRYWKSCTKCGAVKSGYKEAIIGCSSGPLNPCSQADLGCIE